MKRLLQLRELLGRTSLRFRVLSLILCVPPILGFGVYGDAFASRSLTICAVFALLFVLCGELLRLHIHSRFCSLIRRTLFAASLVATSGFCLVEYRIFAFKTYPDQASDYILVLGAGLKRGDQASVLMLSRLDRAVELHRSKPGAKLIVSGGQGRDETRTEASVMRDYLLSRGLSSSEILMEDKSTTTAENIAFTKTLLLLRHAGRLPALSLVTSEFHLYRASGLASRAGLTVYPIAARTPTIELSNYALREFFAVLKSYVQRLRGNPL